MLSSFDVRRSSQLLIPILDTLSQLTSSLHPMGLPLSPSAYSALEPTLWALLNQAPTSLEDDTSSKLFEAVLQHFDKCAAASEGKKVAFEFISRIVLVRLCSLSSSVFATASVAHSLLSFALAQLQTDPSYTNRFTLDLNHAITSPTDPLHKYYLSLPKTLWELGPKHPSTTSVSFARVPFVPSSASTNTKLFRIRRRS